MLNKYRNGSRWCALTCALCLALSATLAQATFKQREERWAAQIQETLLVGEPVWLSVTIKGKEQKFFNIYTPAQGTVKGGVILLHGIGMHPDWPEVISPLRRALPERGWTTFSMQMPLLPAGAPYTAFGPILDETPPRIRAGIEFLRAKGIEHIVVIGHDMGAAMAASFVAGEPRSGIDGLVVVGLDAPVLDRTADKLDPRLHGPTQLAKVKVPVLDIYGGLDKKTVMNSAPARAAAARQAGNKNYRQVRVPDADHFFSGYDKALLENITRWLDGGMNGAP